MSTPGHPSSDNAMAGGDAATPAPPPGTSSPLAFPSSSPSGKSMSGASSQASAARRQQLRTPGNFAASSPLQFPTSSPLNTPRARGAPLHQGRGLPSSGLRSGGATSAGEDGPLFFPSSSTQSTPRSVRGEIRPMTQTTPIASRRRRPDTTMLATPGMPSSQLGNSQSDLTLSQQEPTTDPEHADDDRVLWGTQVTVGETLSLFRTFLQSFRLKYRWAYVKSQGKTVNRRSKAEGEQLIYEGYMNQMRATNQTLLNLRITDLACFGPSKKLAYWVVKYPNEVIPIMDQVLKDEMIGIVHDENHRLHRGDIGLAEQALVEGNNYKVRIFGLDSINMRDLNPNDIDQLVTVRGLVIRATAMIPDMREAFFRCLKCNHTMVAELDRGRIEEPTRCPREACRGLGTLSLIHNRCEFADRQVIRLQETPDVVPDGQTPHSVTLCAFDELVDMCKPGDRVEITGIFRGQPVRVNPRQRSQKSLYKTYVDIVHIKRGNARRLGVDASTRDDSEQVGALGVGGDEDDESDQMQMFGSQAPASRAQEQDLMADAAPTASLQTRLEEIADRPDVYELLARSLAPSIWEMDDVKKGILLQLFGGTNKTISMAGRGSTGSQNQGGPRYRGDINVLMVGDPGTSKSQLLKYVHKLAPRGVYASGKGSSAVGLTAYVTRDPDTKQLVLESGALVLSDGGVCCIDEFDKMNDSTRSVLHEVMEQQTVSIAKAGIITTLNARTSVLAAANPVGSKYNVMMPITKNIDLPPTLISRFDLVYLVLDKVDEGSDRRLARHLLGLYIDDGAEASAANAATRDTLPMETLTAYISYARNNIHPQITAAAGEALARQYVQLRKAGGDDPRSAEKRITATTRQLESGIRLAEAHARMRLRKEVLVDDVDEAFRLIREAAKSSATDPTTGLIDLDLLNTGRGVQQRRLAGDLQRSIAAVLDDGKATSGAGMRYTELTRRLGEQSSIPIDASELWATLQELEGSGAIRMQGHGDRRTIRKTAGAFPSAGSGGGRADVAV